MTTTVIVSAEDAYRDGLLIGNPDHVFDGEAFEGDSNSVDVWPPEPQLSIRTGRQFSRLACVVTTEDVAIAITYKNHEPADVPEVPVRVTAGGRTTYAVIVPAGICKIWIRKL